MKTMLVVAGLAAISLVSSATAEDHRAAQPTTYCNPMNIDVAHKPPGNFPDSEPHRATADPVIVLYRDRYYLFSTNQTGYWHSSDLIHWDAVIHPFLTPEIDSNSDLCAPAVWVMDDALYVYGSSYKNDMPIYRSTDPVNNQWEVALKGLAPGCWDPAFFVDDDGKVYVYHGSSNTKPIHGFEINPKTFDRIGQQKAFISPHGEQHGWERFGEANDNTSLAPFVEGAWMSKHDRRYYLQYGAPGTEFSGYADGVYVSDQPLGPFEYQLHNPFAYKPGGFARGAGHGATFQDRYGNWWHVSTISISVKQSFERRNGLWPAGFDDDGVLFCNTAYGDYPHHAPAKRWRDKAEGPHSTFAGWMLLNYGKPVRASSLLPGHPPNCAVDESIRTYWSAKSGAAGEWFETDLGAVMNVYAIQINYADQQATLHGRQPHLRTRYRLLHSVDGETWQMLVDKSNSERDTPHDYVELAAPVRTRFIRIENVALPTGWFALSGLRVFGLGDGQPPGQVEQFTSFRGASEPRNTWLRWRTTPNATGYVIYAGAEPEKLYSSIMVYGPPEYVFRAMQPDKPHYFAIEAFNENGIGPRSAVLEAPVPEEE